MNRPRYLSLSRHLRGVFGRRVQKIPLDADFSCPNRDGTISRSGCAFCNGRGSGTGLGTRGLDLAGQWEFWRERFDRKYKKPLYMAYLQSFSNTHGPVEKLADTLLKLHGLTRLEALAVGTRPDCLDPAKLELLAAFPARETWLELGLQSADDSVLARINRGHDAACFATAARAGAGAGLKICAHLVAGLPGEAPDGLLKSVDFINALPVAGVKFHNLYVCRGTAMERMWRAGKYEPLALDEYTAMLCRAVDRLRPDVVVQRLTGDPAPGELAAPAWAGDKRSVLAAVRAAFERMDVRQGRGVLKERNP